MDMSNFQLRIFANRKTLIILAFVVIFLFVSILIVGPAPSRNTDFVTFWTAGYMFGHGLNPYNSAQWLATRHQFGVTWDPDPIFPYPLALVLVLWPFSFFDYPQAFVIWIFLSQIAIALACILLLARVSPANRQQLFIPLFLGLSIFRPVSIILLYGQLGAFLLLILATSAFLLEKEKWLWGGFFVGLIMLKPSIGFLVVGAAFLWGVWQRRWHFLAGQILANITLFLLGWLQNKDWVAETIEYGRAKFISTSGLHPTVWDWQSFVCSGQSNCTYLTGGVIILILISAAFLCTRLNLRSPKIMLAIATPLVLAFSPYIWAYDHILCIFGIVVLMAELVALNKNFWIIAFVPLSAGIMSWFVLAIAATVRQDIWGAILPLFCCFLYFLLPARAEKRVAAESLIETGEKI